MTFAYHGFDDPASGAKGGDAHGAAVAHAEDKLIVLDGARRWAPPFSPASVVVEAAEWFKSYGITDITGDRWSGELIREAFREQGIRYVPTEQDKSQLYLEFHRLMNAGRVRLLDLPELLREARGLERRRGSEGRDKVDHRRGSHDDLINAVAGACVAAAHGEYNPVRLWGGEGRVRSVAEIEDDEHERAELAREASERAITAEIARTGAFFPGDGAPAGWGWKGGR